MTNHELVEKILERIALVGTCSACITTELTLLKENSADLLSEDLDAAMVEARRLQSNVDQSAAKLLGILECYPPGSEWEAGEQ